MTPASLTSLPTGGSAKAQPVAIVPFRCPWHGKSRLRRELPPALCDALAYAMFADVLATLRSSGVRRTFALVHGSCGIPAAVEAGAVPLVQPDSCTDLTSALEWAVGTSAAETILIAAADVPCLLPADVALMLSRTEDLVVAPTQDGGTAAIRITPERGGVVLDFGGASAGRHVFAARRRGSTAILLSPSERYHDVDVFRDLLAAAATGTGPATTAVLDSVLRAVGRLPA